MWMPGSPLAELSTHRSDRSAACGTMRIQSASLGGPDSRPHAVRVEVVGQTLIRMPADETRAALRAGDRSTPPRCPAPGQALDGGVVVAGDDRTTDAEGLIAGGPDGGSTGLFRT